MHEMLSPIAFTDLPHMPTKADMQHPEVQYSNNPLVTEVGVGIPRLFILYRLHFRDAHTDRITAGF